jgi:hypothetical protein
MVKEEEYKRSKSIHRFAPFVLQLLRKDYTETENLLYKEPLALLPFPVPWNFEDFSVGFSVTKKVWVSAAILSYMSLTEINSDEVEKHFWTAKSNTTTQHFNKITVFAPRIRIS